MNGGPKGKGAWFLLSLALILVSSFFCLLFTQTLFWGRTSPNNIGYAFYGGILILIVTYFWRGWGKTLFLVWEYPNKSSTEPVHDKSCTACSRRGILGQFYSKQSPLTGKTNSGYICNDCIKTRHRDYKFLWLTAIVIGLILTQLIFNPASDRTEQRVGDTIWITESPISGAAPLGSILIGLAGGAFAIYSIYSFFKPIQESDYKWIGEDIIKDL